MACTLTEKRAQWNIEKVSYEAELAVINSALLNTTDIEEYRFDSGDGSQRVKYRSLKEMTDRKDYLIRQIDFLNRKINGCVLTRLDLRRR